MRLSDAMQKRLEETVMKAGGKERFCHLTGYDPAVVTDALKKKNDSRFTPAMLYEAVKLLRASGVEISGLEDKEDGLEALRDAEESLKALEARLAASCAPESLESPEFDLVAPEGGLSVAAFEPEGPDEPEPAKDGSAPDADMKAKDCLYFLLNRCSLESFLSAVGHEYREITRRDFTDSRRKIATNLFYGLSSSGLAGHIPEAVLKAFPLELFPALADGFAIETTASDAARASCARREREIPLCAFLLERKIDLFDEKVFSHTRVLPCAVRFFDELSRGVFSPEGERLLLHTVNAKAGLDGKARLDRLEDLKAFLKKDGFRFVFKRAKVGTGTRTRRATGMVPGERDSSAFGFARVGRRSIVAFTPYVVPLEGAFSPAPKDEFLIRRASFGEETSYFVAKLSRDRLKDGYTVSEARDGLDETDRTYSVSRKDLFCGVVGKVARTIEILGV